VATDDPDAVLAFWTRFDLDSRRLALDKQSLEMTDARDASAKARKRLAECTKEFRRKNAVPAAADAGPPPAAPDAAAVLGDTKALLSEYQQEIDALTRRARCGDNSFLNLYKVGRRRERSRADAAHSDRAL
jgi:homeobox protein cut-like